MATLNVVLNPRRQSYVRMFYLLTGIAAIVSLIWGWESGFKVERAVSLPPLPKGYALEDLWFSPDGQLVMVMREPDKSTVAVGIWIPGEKPSEISVHKVDLLGFVPQSVQPMQVRYSHGTRATGRAWHLILPYAVSQNGASLAAVIGETLYVGNLSEWSKAVQVPLKPSELDEDSPGAEDPPSPVEALVFSASDLVTVVQADRSISHRDYVRRSQGRFSTKMPAVPLIWSRGSRLLISSPETGDFGLLNVQGADAFTTAGYGQFSSQNVSVAGVSADGSRIAFGTEDGIIDLYSVRPGEHAPIFSRTIEGLPLPVSRPVRALSLLDGGEILIAGDFQDIYLLDADLNLESLTPTQGTVRLMAIHDENLVYAMPQRLIAAKVENRRLPDWLVLTWMATLYAIAVSILAFFYSVHSKQSVA